MTGTWFIGADLASREGTAGRMANETGAAVTGGDGQILDAGRTRGAGKTTGWADRAAEDGHAVMFADAPLVVASETSQRLRETQAGQRYGRWKVSVNTANVHPRGWRACSSCAWPDCQAGDIPTAAAGRRAQAGSSRRPARTPRWPTPRNWL